MLFFPSLHGGNWRYNGGDGRWDARAGKGRWERMGMVGCKWLARFGVMPWQPLHGSTEE